MSVKYDLLPDCPNCGAVIPPSTGDTRHIQCGSCRRYITIEKVRDVQNMPAPLITKHINFYRKAMEKGEESAPICASLAMMYLKLKFYDKALVCFDKAIEEDFTNGDLYYYAAICCLEGKIPFLNSKPVIENAEKYLKAAISMEEKGIYYYLWAFIKRDYYARKSLRTTPSWEQVLEESFNAGFTDEDAQELLIIFGKEELF